ncbi:hypothetical protein [Roseomonas sp. WA12]
MQPALPPQTVIGFNYAGVSPADAELLRVHAASARRVLAQGDRLVGALLLEAKKILPHGQFGAWVMAELNIGSRHAQRLLAAARVRAESDKLSHLPTSVLVLLDAPQVPSELVQQIAAEAEAGAPINAKIIADRIEAARAGEREVKRVAVSRRCSETKARALIQHQQAKRDEGQRLLRNVHPELWDDLPAGDQKLAERLRRKALKAAEDAAKREAARELAKLYPEALPLIRRLLGASASSRAPLLAATEKAAQRRQQAA